MILLFSFYNFIITTLVFFHCVATTLVLGVGYKTDVPKRAAAVMKRKTDAKCAEQIAGRN
jgi:hypothetical protein